MICTKGHSWAGGYADNDSGNNQESASESLFSWVSMCIFGEFLQKMMNTEMQEYLDLQKMEAVEGRVLVRLRQKDNWIKEWPYNVVGQVYGGINFYGTFFGGQPLLCLWYSVASDFRIFNILRNESRADVLKYIKDC